MSKPTHDVLVAEPYTQNGQEKVKYTKVGAAWPTKDANGFSFRICTIPGVWLYILPVFEDKKAVEPWSAKDEEHF